ncbi:VanZ family protein, partial [Nitrosomonas sp.]
CLMMTKESIIHAAAIILMLAGGTEMAQLYIDGRSPLITDFFIDAAGGLLGITLIKLIGANKNTVQSAYNQ